MHVTISNHIQTWHVLHLQMLFERRKELLTQSQVSQSKKDNPTISTAVSSARTTDNAAADSTRCVDQAQLSNSKPFTDNGKVTVSTVVDTKQTADRPDTSADPFIAGSAAVRLVKTSIKMINPSMQ